MQLNLLFLVQEVPEGVIDAVTKVSPYNAGAFGLLVLVLLGVIWMLYKDKGKQADSMEKVVETLRDIEVQLHALQDLKMLIMSKLLNAPPNNDS